MEKWDVLIIGVDAVCVYCILYVINSCVHYRLESNVYVLILTLTLVLNTKDVTSVRFPSMSRDT